MRFERTADAADASRQAAELLVEALQESLAARGRATLALSGGKGPEPMIEQLASSELPWERIEVFQVDERIAPHGDAARNLTMIERAFGPIRERLRLHPMPVERGDLDEAARDYQRALEAVAGAPAVIDALQLGLGNDGHTASLFPGGALLRITDRDVAVTEKARPSEGTGAHRRMTLTLPALARARRIVWLVTGAAKAAPLAELIAGSGDSPAVRVERERAIVVADAAAARDVRA